MEKSLYDSRVTDFITKESWSVSQYFVLVQGTVFTERQT